MKIESKPNCPLNTFEPCKQLECAWFIEMAGQNPQTGEVLKEWGCAITWIPMLLVNTIRAGHSTAASVESFRNEMVKANESTQQALITAAQLANQTMKTIEVK